MQEYKREYSRAQEQIAQLNEKQIDYEAHLSTVDLYWNKVCRDFQFAVRVNLIDQSILSISTLTDHITSYITSISSCCKI